MTHAATAPATKRFHAGTHRTCTPNETWERIHPLFTRFGITRVADVTGLDTIGIPVAMAVRPLAKTLAVSQGKGQSLMSAKVSAAMESVELWHAEHVLPPVIHRDVPARKLGLSYRVADMAGLPGSLVSDFTPFDWIPAIGLVTGQIQPVPCAVVRLLSPGEQPWLPAGLTRTSNGLASGNCAEEAALHALYEIIERDSVSRLPADEFGDPIDPSSVDDPGNQHLIDRIHRAGAYLEINRILNRFGVPCFSARIWSMDFPLVSIGFGAHLASDVALSRAITEAAQSRLTVIAGSRDDIPALYDHVREGAARRTDARGADMAWPDLPRASAGPFTDIADELRWVSAAVTDVLGNEPLMVDLSERDDVAVVKVVVPGAKMDQERYHSA